MFLIVRFDLFSAYHLVTCSKRTAYQKKPEPRYFEYDDEQEEFNPFEPYGDGMLFWSEHLFITLYVLGRR